MLEFARHRGWDVRDGHIYFPAVAAPPTSTSAAIAAEEDGAAGGQQEKEFSRVIIENTLGYARELETIV